MSNTVKNSLYTIGLLIVVFLVWNWRNSEKDLQKTSIVFEGQTMGTTYKIIYFGDEYQRDVQFSVDSLLMAFNKSLSTYDPTSEISLFNSGSSFSFQLPWFLPVLEESQLVYTQSEGTFDPTVMPLVRVWGFGPDDLKAPDSMVVDSVKRFIGFDKIVFNNSSVTKSIPGVQLDFSAIAKGYAVDVVSEYMYSLGYENTFVEIGGEVRTRGSNLENKSDWKIGITDPGSSSLNVNLFGILQVSGNSVATSGNYFNYYIVDGKRFSHTIDPKSGYPAQKEILSATVVAENCITADAWATAFMVMGHKKAIEKLKENKGIEGIILFSGENGEIMEYVSDNLKDKYEKL